MIPPRHVKHSGSIGIRNADGTYLGYTTRVESGMGTSYEALVHISGHKHLSVGFFDRRSVAEERVIEWSEDP